VDYALARFRQLKGDDAELPDYFVTAQSLSPSDHIAVQAAVQEHIDSSISKTINCPEDISFEDFKEIYEQAWTKNLKGCTTYRPSDIRGSVLTVTPEKSKEEKPAPEKVKEVAASYPEDNSVVYMAEPLQRDDILPGYTYKLKWPESDHAIYITLNDIVQDGRRRPFEIFINSKNMEHYAWTVALTRMISAVFRRGGDVTFVVEELKAVFDPRGGAWMDGKYIPSLLAAIGGFIEQHMRDIGFLVDAKENNTPASQTQAEKKAVGDQSGPPMASCPRCGERALMRQEGCDSCTSCGYSRCG